VNGQITIPDTSREGNEPMKMEPAESFVVDQPLRRLRDALRHPETWPPGFEFDYRRCATCAIGLAHELGMLAEMSGPAVMKAFGLPYAAQIAIFSAGYDNPSADDVADRIDAYLARSA
jgi:hypothetical protein